MGRCDGFCRPDGPDAAEYRRRMAQATALLEGKLRAVTTQLREQMNAAAEALDFETAAALRDRVRALSVLAKDQQVIAGICADTDVWGAYQRPPGPAAPFSTLKTAISWPGRPRCSPTLPTARAPCFPLWCPSTIWPASPCPVRYCFPPPSRTLTRSPC